MRRGSVVAAELIKLRGLPVVPATVLGTIGVAIALAACISASARTPMAPEQTLVAMVPFLQIGLILLGILTVATECQGSQFRTTLTATPARLRLLAAKTLAYLLMAAITSAAAVGAGLAAAAITLAARDGAPTDGTNGWSMVGAVVYLVLIGLLALALAVVLRALIPPLVAMLALVLIVSPLVGGSTEHARWLPDRAGSLLYLPPGDSVLTAGTGALVLLAWITATAIAAATTFQARDA